MIYELKVGVTPFFQFKNTAATNSSSSSSSAKNSQQERGTGDSNGDGDKHHQRGGDKVEVEVEVEVQGNDQHQPPMSDEERGRLEERKEKEAICKRILEGNVDYPRFFSATSKVRRRESKDGLGFLLVSSFKSLYRLVIFLVQHNQPFPAISYFCLLVFSLFLTSNDLFVCLSLFIYSLLGSG
jgi:hypothetical protein